MIGLGIVTWNRPDTFDIAYSSVKKHLIDTNRIDKAVVYNDGSTADYSSVYTRCDNTHILHTEQNRGVAHGKNQILKHLLDSGCDYLFVMEDDQEILSPDVCDTYIEAHKKSGLHHFSFAYHGPMNQAGWLDADHDLNVAWYHACVGAFCFYTRECLEAVGLMDEQFINVFEHVEHTARLARAGYTSPFWRFADVANSKELLREQYPDMPSIIGSRADWWPNFRKGQTRIRELMPDLGI